MPNVSDDAIAIAAAGLVQAHVAGSKTAQFTGDEIAKLYRHYAKLVVDGGFIHETPPDPSAPSFDDL